MDDGSSSGARIVNAARRFGHELRRRRTQAGLTQRELAVRINYSREMITAVERGRRYGSMELAVRCDQALGGEGHLTRLWPLVESEQVAADRRRGPRITPPPPLPRRRVPAAAMPEPVIPVGPRPPVRPAPAWIDWARSSRPVFDDAPPELVAQLRDLINDLVYVNAHGTT